MHLDGRGTTVAEASIGGRGGSVGRLLVLVRRNSGADAVVNKVSLARAGSGRRGHGVRVSALHLLGRLQKPCLGLTNTRGMAQMWRALPVCSSKSKEQVGHRYLGGLVAPAEGSAHGIVAAGGGMKAGGRPPRGVVVDEVGVVDLPPASQPTQNVTASPRRRSATTNGQSRT